MSKRPGCSQKRTRANKNAKLPVSKAGGQDRCLHQDSSVRNKRTISIRSQKKQRKSGARAKDDGRAAGAPCRTAALPVCHCSRPAHTAPASAGPVQRSIDDQAAIQRPAHIPEEASVRPPKIAMIGARAAASSTPHTSHPMPSCLGQRARGGSPHRVPRGEHRRAPAALSRQFHVSPVASPCARCPRTRAALAPGALEEHGSASPSASATLKRAARSASDGPMFSCCINH
jgi:hypothetical protein